MRKDRAKKKAHREKYGIGWRPERAPGGQILAGLPPCGPSLKGMCGVALQEDSGSIRLVRPEDPSSAVNAEYLATALQVRRCEGREPLFSLDPDYRALGQQFGDRDTCWQRKRFEPEWLGRTSMGEVLFQADYHLKELSMGEHAQPVAGMKSCFDMFKEDGQGGQRGSGGWIAREWFVVRSAEMRVSEGNVLTPCVHMGVEARELVDGPEGVEDARLTRADHPLVRYAEAFTHYFDLIAERKSVVHELREVAKACLLAKYLVESEIPLEDYWVSWADEASAGKTQSCAEIPQLWNERRYHQVCLADGQLTDSQHGAVGDHSVFGVYGGVEMSLDRIELANLMVSAKKSLVVSATIPTEARAPQGVDLNLDTFSVSAPLGGAEEGTGSWKGGDLVGASFWAALEAGGEGPVREEDRELLHAVFHPCLSDRREDGDLFLPPGTSAGLVRRLRELADEEAAARRRRLEHFRGASFSIADPGPLFPAAWVPSLEISRRGQAGPQGALQARPDYLADAPRLLKSAEPIFDQRTEDGARFRIYRVGSLEVRTVQEHAGQEGPCAVYSSFAASSKPRPDCSVTESEQISKVKLYVERMGSSASLAKEIECTLAMPLPKKRFFTVLETASGHAILIELLEDGKVRWTVNPEDLEARSSLSKVVRTSDCRSAGTTVRGMMDCRADQARAVGAFSESMSKRVALGAYSRACSA